MSVGKSGIYASITLLLGLLVIIMLSLMMKNYFVERDEIDKTLCMHDAVERVNARYPQTSSNKIDATLAEVKKQCDVEIDTN